MPVDSVGDWVSAPARMSMFVKCVCRGMDRERRTAFFLSEGAGALCDETCQHVSTPLATDAPFQDFAQTVHFAKLLLVFEVSVRGCWADASQCATVFIR